MSTTCVGTRSGAAKCCRNDCTSGGLVGQARAQHAQRCRLTLAAGTVSSQDAGAERSTRMDTVTKTAWSGTCDADAADTVAVSDADTPSPEAEALGDADAGALGGELDGE